jgi:hypothetical protein
MKKEYLYKWFLIKTSKDEAIKAGEKRWVGAEDSAQVFLQPREDKKGNAQGHWINLSDITFEVVGEQPAFYFFL